MRDLFFATDLKDILVKVESGERLSKADGVRLMKSNDLLTLGFMAKLVKERKTGNKVFFIQNLHINHTNICVNRCKLCAFGVDENSLGSYLLSLEEIETKAAEMVGENISEVHIVGGLHPLLPFDYYVEMLQRVKRILPGIHIQAFTAVEIDYFARTAGLTLEEVFVELKKAGLGSLPGGGAEVFSQRVREKICETKISGTRWLEVMEAAHHLGIRSNATMLYGHVETMEERVDHLLRLRELQDHTGGFMSFIPLAFHPKNTGLEQLQSFGTTGLEDLKVLAVARLMLDNFDHIKAFWIMIGPKLAQVSLAFGVDDLDGTVKEEKITHAAGAKTEQMLAKQKLVKMIKAAGYNPVERDTLYNIIQEEF